MPAKFYRRNISVVVSIICITIQVNAPDFVINRRVGFWIHYDHFWIIRIVATVPGIIIVPGIVAPGI
jgi:hypothetical protein